MERLDLQLETCLVLMQTNLKAQVFLVAKVKRDHKLQGHQQQEDYSEASKIRMEVVYLDQKPQTTQNLQVIYLEIVKRVMQVNQTYLVSLRTIPYLELAHPMEVLI